MSAAKPAHSPLLVDSHCHIHLLREDGAAPAAVIEAATAEGVHHFLNVAVDTASLPELLTLSRRFPELSTSVGVHPSGEEEIGVETLASLAAAPEVVAVGETGLDYHYLGRGVEAQQASFRRHVAAAREIDKPLIIHTRAAPEDTLAILKEEKAHQVGGVIHCFTEDWAMAQAFMDEGFYISFSGIVTFRNADALRDVARRLPLERMLVETDSPYLAPVPHRGRDNQPAYLRHIVETIAAERDCAFADIAAATTRNFFTLFPAAGTAD